MYKRQTITYPVEVINHGALSSFTDAPPYRQEVRLSFMNKNYAVLWLICPQGPPGVNVYTTVCHICRNPGSIRATHTHTHLACSPNVARGVASAAAMSMVIMAFRLYSLGTMVPHWKQIRTTELHNFLQYTKVQQNSSLKLTWQWRTSLKWLFSICVMVQDVYKRQDWSCDILDIP